MALKALYGVAGLGPVQLSRYVTRVSGGCALVQGNRVHKTGPLPKVPSVVYSSLSQFLKHEKRVTKDHIAFVIDAPENLETVNGILGLGYSKLKSGHYAYTQLKDDELRMCLEEAGSTEEITWVYRPVNHIKDMIHDDTADAVVNKLRSVLYSVQAKDDRAALTVLVYGYLVGAIPLAKVEQGANSRLGPKSRARLFVLLKSDDCKAVRAAFSEYKKRPLRATKICKTYQVSMFTLRYLEAKASKVVSKVARVRH